ncbi:MAG: GNAT family N-acetyltransferase [Thioalkalivibrio sp.]|nr:GNAT family N-acetyltransferase [Thioalkalivibrio sp.]
MRIRRLEPGDVHQIADLWRYWFRDKSWTPDPDLEALVRRVYLERPEHDPEIPSLVADNGRGRIIGFLGATTVPVVVDGARGTLAGVFPPVIHPDEARTVATFLLRRFLSGPQVLTFSDGGHVKFEPIWEGLGGRISPTASIRWLKVLRPMRLGANVLRHRGGVWRMLAPLSGLVADGADALARRTLPEWLGTAGPIDGYTGIRLTPAGLIDLIECVHGDARLRPTYSERYLTWLFDAMRNIRSQGDFVATAVLAPDGSPVGWWVAYLNRGGVSRVFALDGLDHHLHGVGSR